MGNTRTSYHSILGTSIISHKYRSGKIYTGQLLQMNNIDKHRQDTLCIMFYILAYCTRVIISILILSDLLFLFIINKSHQLLTFNQPHVFVFQLKLNIASIFRPCSARRPFSVCRRYVVAKQI